MSDSKPEIHVTNGVPENPYEPFESALNNAGFGLEVELSIPHDMDSDMESQVFINGVMVCRLKTPSEYPSPEAMLEEIYLDRARYADLIPSVSAGVKSRGYSTKADRARGVIGVCIADMVITEVVFEPSDLESDPGDMVSAIVASVEANLKPAKRVFDIPSGVSNSEVEEFKSRIEDRFEEASKQEVNGTIAGQLKRGDMHRKKMRALRGPEKGGSQ
jgi:hypothetical protein